MSARDVIARTLTRHVAHGVTKDAWRKADAILSALSAMPLTSRLALARALVPEMAVVPREATEEMLKAGAVAQWRKMQDIASPAPTEHPEEGGGSLGYAYRAMITAAEEPPHGS